MQSSLNTTLYPVTVYSPVEASHEGLGNMHKDFIYSSV